MKLLFGGSDRQDAWPDIQRKIYDTGKIEQWRKDGININPDFIEVELETGEARFIADRFFDISSGRSSNGWGVSPITWLDLDAYCRLRRTKMSNWEMDLLRMIDGYFCKYANEDKGK